MAVGGDSRLSTPAIRSAAAETLAAEGYNVLDCGLCSTPSMYMITKLGDKTADASVMVTASHHPSDKNGLKFFLPTGGLSGGEIAEILKKANAGEKVASANRRQNRKIRLYGSLLLRFCAIK